MTRPSQRGERCFDTAMVVQARRVLAVTLAAVAVAGQAQTAPAQRPAGQGPSPSSIEALFKRVGDELTVHVTSEEQIFYPAVKEKRTEDILLESLEVS